MKGVPFELYAFESAGTRTNRYFKEYSMPDFERIYLPESMLPFTDSSPICTKQFIVDDNRSAIDPNPVLSIDGTEFYFSVKGIGSITSPFTRQPLTTAEISTLVRDRDVKRRIRESEATVGRYITGELWSRGSPYGGQGIFYAAIAMRASEMASTPTSIHGFRIGPLVKIVYLPEYLENQTKQVYWYRSFKERTVQEARLVPSNVRIYFHSDHKIGEDTCTVFDQFGLNTNEKAIQFELNFIKSGMSVLTLFSRSIKDNGNGTFSGLDFYDIWLDKDAVVAPDGTIYFVDLEGLEWITLWEKDVEEKLEYQIYRSMYEFQYAYQQIERERVKRFGHPTGRKTQFEWLLKTALADDEILTLEHDGSSLQMVIGNILGEKKFTKNFTLIDWSHQPQLRLAESTKNCLASLNWELYSAVAAQSKVS